MSVSENYPEKMLHFAAHHPIKAVAVASLAVSGAVPVVCFLVYAVGTLLCTLVAAVVLDVALLALGVFGLAVALCFVGCFSACAAGVFSLLFLGYRTARGGWSKARSTLSPSTVTPSSLPTEPHMSEPVDKNKHVVRLPTALTTFVARLFSLMNWFDQFGDSGTDNDTDVEEELLSQQPSEYEQQSDLYKTSLLVLFLSFSITFMLSLVFFSAYVVVTYS